MAKEQDEVELLPKYEVFLASYLRNWNATKAYLKIHPQASRATAAVEGCRLVKKLNPTIKQFAESNGASLGWALKLLRDIVKGKVPGYGYRERADLLKSYIHLLSNTQEESDKQEGGNVTIKVVGGGYLDEARRIQEERRRSQESEGTGN